MKRYILGLGLLLIVAQINTVTVFDDTVRPKSTHLSATTGKIDTNFGTAGTYIPTSLGTSDIIYAMQMQSDGAILIAGYATVSGEFEWRAQELTNYIDPLKLIVGSSNGIL